MSDKVGSEDFIPLSSPVIGGNEWAYVKDCLDRGWVSTAGSYVTRFENDFAKFCGVGTAAAFACGTAALQVALRLSGVGQDDEVLVSNLTFISPANAISYLGAHPVFVDAEPDYWQMDVNLVRQFLEQDCVKTEGGLINRRTHRRIAAILPVHILGHPVDMDPLLALARQYQLPVIEDATESLGATYKGRPVGTMGDFGCFSFNGNKMMTTGGGGMLVSMDAGAIEKARYLSTQAKDDPIAFVHHEIGYNNRMTNMAAAMGCAQLEQLGNFVAKRRQVANRYRVACADLPSLAFMGEAGDCQHACWLSTVTFQDAGVTDVWQSAYQAFRDASIETRPLWQPLSNSIAHQGAISLGGAVAQSLSDKSISLPSSPDLSRESQDRVIKILRSIVDDFNGL